MDTSFPDTLREASRAQGVVDRFEGLAEVVGQGVGLARRGSAVGAFPEVNRALVQGLLSLLAERMMTSLLLAGGGERDERADDARNGPALLAGPVTCGRCGQTESNPATAPQADPAKVPYGRHLG